jgi:predicted nucleic acid-binding protein
MIVIDASVLANVVGDDGHTGRAARARVAAAEAASAPDLVDVEVVSVLRKRWLAGTLTARRFKTAVVDLIDLPLARYPVAALMIRAYELRGNVTPYDATYIALAEGLSCPLLTVDVRLTRAAGLRCQVEVFAV